MRTKVRNKNNIFFSCCQSIQLLCYVLPALIFYYKIVFLPLHPVVSISSWILHLLVGRLFFRFPLFCVSTQRDSCFSVFSVSVNIVGSCWYPSLIICWYISNVSVSENHPFFDIVLSLVSKSLVSCIKFCPFYTNFYNSFSIPSIV